ncbi:Helix-turn-helix domain [uncultured Ruminococcus sp.]|uniref:Helix-turn-helix domain-containing protein n=1 Tax=Hydrogeniiclostridium mannosilyticum TaxID=2764322 RepID=A0A328U7V5_9FIRM|nr:helix-turn-helix domain-containing protein [Hydrogeniiclostridium mannosilyticum]RAQ22134.1 helix-turn-helix domain-containing protein [Hydrogeniiclostridium mannosilyticum]SCH33527.1 Helix-turn-helix domain [uncultured Ruminococcus sp.]
MDFKELLILAKANHSKALETILSMYRPLLMKEAVVNGTFDEDLFQELCIVFLRCVRNFRI